MTSPVLPLTIGPLGTSRYTAEPLREIRKEISVPWWAWLLIGIVIGVTAGVIYGTIWLIRNGPFKNM
jgi:hypothetical protein